MKAKIFMVGWLLEKQCILFYYTGPKWQMNVGGITVEAEPSHQYCYILFLCDGWQ